MDKNERETLLVSASPDNDEYREEAIKLGFTESQIIVNRVSFAHGLMPNKINGTTVEYEVLPDMIDDFRRILKRLNLSLLTEVDLYIEEKKEAGEGVMKKLEGLEQAIAA